LKNAASSSTAGRSARSLPPARTDSLTPVHADKVLGAHGNGERLSSSRRTGRVYLRVVGGALAGETLSIEQSRSDSVALAPGRLNHQDELLIARRGPACGVKFQCPSRKDLFEARMCISSQHTASAVTALSLDVIRSIAQLPDRASRGGVRRSKRTLIGRRPRSTSLCHSTRIWLWPIIFAAPFGPIPARRI
jgi:hypothetical protein